MGVSEASKLFENFGLPVAIIICLMLFIYFLVRWIMKINDQHASERKEMHVMINEMGKEHTQAFNRNTEVLSRLTTLIEREK